MSAETRPVVLLATPGGHLHELFELSHRLPQDQPRVWVTARTPQSTSLLAGEAVHFVPPVGTRQLGRAAATFPSALRLLRQLRPVAVMSTGAAICVPYLVAARLLGVTTSYIESLTRLQGLSLTGRVMAAVPGVRLYHQGLADPGRRWRYIGSTLDNYSTTPAQKQSVQRVLVTLGTERFPFPRLIERARPAASQAHVVWQTGHTPAPEGLPGEVHQWLSYDEMLSEMGKADVVVTHAGVGSVLASLSQGVVPLVLARSPKEGEHVDDHQEGLRRQLSERGLAVDLAEAEIGQAMDQARSRAVDNHRATPPLEL